MPNARRRLDWFKLYPADFFNSHNVILMSHAERGAYLFLLMRAWLERDCSLPNDDLILARLLYMTPEEWQAVAPAVKKNFRVRKDGRLYNQRLLDERKQAIASAEKIQRARQARYASESPCPDPPSQERPDPDDETRQDETETRRLLPQQTCRTDLQNRPANASAFAGNEGSRGGAPPVVPLLYNSFKPWVNRIWYELLDESHILVTSGKRDSEGIERLILECGERVAMVAWYLYVNESPPKYHLAPVEFVNKRMRKDGQTWLESGEDESSITRFPVLAFLATCQGYVDAAKEKRNDERLIGLVAKAAGVQELPND